MIGVQVRSNFKQVIAEFTPLHQGIIDKATVRALNRALDTTQTVANSEIRQKYNIKAKALRAAMKKKRAHRGQAYAFARLEVTGTLIPLIEFDARWKPGRKLGASVRIKKGGARRTLRGTFIGVHGATGARQVFRRVGKTRYPIMTMRSLSLPQAFFSRVVIAATDAAARESFDKNFRQQLKYLSGG